MGHPLLLVTNPWTGMPEEVPASKVPGPRPRQKRFDLEREEREKEELRRQMLKSMSEMMSKQLQEQGLPSTVADYLHAHTRYASYMARNTR